MSSTITVTTNLSQEDRKLLEDLLGGIGLLTTVIGNALPKEAQQTIIEEVNKQPVLVEPDPAPAEEPAPEPVEEPKAEEPKVEASAPVILSLAEFQKAVTLAVSKGPDAKKAVKTIINKYAPSVSGVPEDKRAEVVAELSKI